MGYQLWTRRRPISVLRFTCPACLAFLLLLFLFFPAHVTVYPDTQAHPHPLHNPHSPQASAKTKSFAISDEFSGKKEEDLVYHSDDTQATGLDSKGHITYESREHPIDRLVQDAENAFQKLLTEQSHSLEEAARIYRSRRGRHPPPGFDVWYQFAAQRNAIFVEQFWDQIYHDLHPFWAMPARQLQKDSWDFEMVINVRDGRATTGSNWFWTQIWLDLIQSIEDLLPDMDIALNAMDEPRIVVPWETMQSLVVEANKKLHLTEPENVVDQYRRRNMRTDDAFRNTHKGIKWETTGSYWEIARRSCTASSPARREPTFTNFDSHPQISPEYSLPHMFHGFVQNASLSSDICHQPDLQGLEGIFAGPLSISSTTSLFPIFGGSKLSVNSDILLPAPMYWSQEERFSGGDDHGTAWNKKKDEAVWRGVATGGRSNESNWKAFQRHRFVAMNNGSTLSKAETDPDTAPNFDLPASSYNLSAQRQGRLGDWVKTWSDCAFVDLMCSLRSEDGRCPYVDQHFSTAEGLPLKEQYKSKYLPDIDGNSFSGRYLAFLRSTSLPIKATLWREWHDARLAAWVHYIPMDNRYGDWYGILQYFLGYEDSVQSHDKAAEKIALAGKDWAEKALRKEDMQIYVLRLLLEYARVSDERRDFMGWVGDLK